MRGFKLFCLCSIVICAFQMTWAQPVELILQQGVNGYDGCGDAYVKSSVGTNQGTSQTLESSYYYCSS